MINLTLILAWVVVAIIGIPVTYFLIGVILEQLNATWLDLVSLILTLAIVGVLIWAVTYLLSHYFEINLFRLIFGVFYL